ncbi:MAG: glycosyltransferase family 4 protein [Candidatus Omnitrophica bacterium]|nr:glycosyltransferase family 4 protein [Candidatus Omnitrophota bacterium]
MQNVKNKIIHLARLNPKKFGSFEEYIVRLSHELKKINFDPIIVFENPVPQNLRYHYRDLEIDVLSMENGTFSFYYSLYKLIKRHRPVMIHLSFYPIFSFSTFYIYIFGCRKIIFSDRISGSLNKKNEIKKLLVTIKNIFLMKLIKKIICVSQYVLNRDKMIPGIDASKLTCIFNGVNLNRFNPTLKMSANRRDFNVNKDDFVVSTAAHLISVKGIDYLIKAAASLIEQHKDMIFVIAGEGQEKAELESLVMALGLGHKVRFVALRNDVEKLLSLSDVFALPSVWQEANSWAISEASACGVPVVATSVGGSPEIVKDKVAGILVPPKDHSAIAGAIDFLYKNKEARKNMSAKAAENAKKYLNLERMVAETIKVYQECLEKPQHSL